MRVYMRAEGKSEPSPEHLGEQAAVMGPEAPAAFSRFNSSCRLSFPNHQAHNLWLQAPNGQPQEPYPLGSNGESGLREVRELTPGHTAQGCEGTPCSLTTRAFLEEGAEGRGMDETTPHFPQLLRGLGLCAPALATKMPVKLVRLLVSVGFQGQETCLALSS